MEPTSAGVYKALHDSGVVSEHPDVVRRCIVDLRAGQPPRVLIERAGAEQLLSLGGLLDGIDAGNEGGQ